MNPIIVLLIISVIAFAIGFTFDKIYESYYFESGVNYVSLIIQTVCIVAAVLTYSNTDMGVWFSIAVFGGIISYITGFICCWKQAHNIHASKIHTMMAMIAQAVLPLGFAILIIFIIAYIMGRLSGNKRKHK